MNKYQEAINYVVDRYLDIDYQEKPMNDDTKYALTLQELVERATPKKVEKQEHAYSVDDEYIYTRGICPNCKKWVVVEFADNYDYCQYCGQRLNWEDEYVD